MISYLLYDGTGEIQALGHAMSEEAIVADGRNVYLSPPPIVTADTHWIVNGQIAEKDPRPSPLHKWDTSHGRWVFDTVFGAMDARRVRRQLLEASDWTQLPDVPLSTRAAWADYRQVLRDITDQPGFPEQIDWPTPPNADS